LANTAKRESGVTPPQSPLAIFAACITKCPEGGPVFNYGDFIVPVTEAVNAARRDGRAQLVVMVSNKLEFSDVLSRIDRFLTNLEQEGQKLGATECPGINDMLNSGAVINLLLKPL